MRRVDGRIHTYHPTFETNPEFYTFALTVLEKTPIFEGMKLYRIDTGAEILWDMLLPENWANWTLTPPTKKRTFMLGGREFNSPFAPCKNHKDTIHYFDVGDMRVVFDNKSDRDELHDYLIDLLMQARDKE